MILFKKLRKFFVKNLHNCLSLSGNVATNYLTTGCILYPAEKTCIGK